MAPLNSSHSSDDSLASLNPSAAMMSADALPAPHKSPHRFTVSPVMPESEPLLRSDSQLSNLSVSPMSTFLKVPGPRNTEEDEGFLDGLRRVRHASNRSDATADTFLEDEELGDLPLTPLEGGATSDLVVINETDKLEEGCYENPALLPSPCIITPEPTELHHSDVIYTRAPPVIITSHPSDSSLPHPPTDSLQASHWDVRNPTVQFYVGSCLSVTSAASHVSFFNTLYAHGYTAICRICHQPASDKRPLFTPCQCTGSLRFVHHSCLMRWLDKRTKQLGHNPKCELCVYQFRARKHWRSRKNIRWPSIPTRDKILHCIFFLALILMGISLGVIGTLFKRDDPGDLVEEKKDKSGMSPTETVTLACGIVFFVAFFAATLAQIKASWNLWRMVRIFWDNNYVLQLENDLEANQKDANNTGNSQ